MPLESKGWRRGFQKCLKLRKEKSTYPPNPIGCFLSEAATVFRGTGRGETVGTLPCLLLFLYIYILLQLILWLLDTRVDLHAGLARTKSGKGSLLFNRTSNSPVSWAKKGPSTFHLRTFIWRCQKLNPGSSACKI